MSKKQKLELTWIGKDERPKLEPRTLIEDPELSYHADKRYGDDDIFDNILIQGDNLLALKALENDYRGKVKCIFIDPPYNTGSAFEHYEDGLEHSIWLSLMRDRLSILRNLLSDNGSIFVSIDYNEAHYLKVLMDEIFGRENFQREIIWRIGWLSGFKTKAKNFIRNHDTILYYSKNKEALHFRKLYIEKEDFPPRFNKDAVKEISSKLEEKQKELALLVNTRQHHIFFDHSQWPNLSSYLASRLTPIPHSQRLLRGVLFAKASICPISWSHRLCIA